MTSIFRPGDSGQSRPQTGPHIAVAEMAKKYCMNFGYDGGVRALLCLLGFIWVFAACGGPTTEDDLRSRLEGFFESVLTGDAMSLNDYVSDSCAEKAEFLELVSEAPAIEDAEVEVPDGAFSFDVENGVAVAIRSFRSLPLLVNGKPLRDDPSNDVPLKFVLEDGVWRVENCGAYVSDTE